MSKTYSKTNKKGSIPNMLTSYFNQYIFEKIDIFEKKDFNIYLSSNKIIINYMEKEYVITISTYDDSHYWHLSPYNKSFFETKFTNNKNDFEILLFVIKENQLIYERNEKY